MTHLVYSLYRRGVREPALTLSGMAGGGPNFPTPITIAHSAVTRHHRDGPADAWDYLDQTLANSSYWGQGPPQAVGWANSIRRCFARYQALDAADGRPVFGYSLPRTYELPPDDVALHIDALALDPDGYVARLALWDREVVTTTRAALYAAPVHAVLQDELGAGRIRAIQVWHLRTVGTYTISRTQALAALPEAHRIIRRLAR